MSECLSIWLYNFPQVTKYKADLIEILYGASTPSLCKSFDLSSIWSIFKDLYKYPYKICVFKFFYSTDSDESLYTTLQF